MTERPRRSLRPVHDDFDGETETYRSVESGWAMILSSLKTLLETGKSLAIGQGA